MPVSSDGSKRQPKSVLQINERFGPNRKLLNKQNSHTCASTNIFRGKNTLVVWTVHIYNLSKIYSSLIVKLVR